MQAVPPSICYILKNSESNTEIADVVIDLSLYDKELVLYFVIGKFNVSYISNSILMLDKGYKVEIYKTSDFTCRSTKVNDVIRDTSKEDQILGAITTNTSNRYVSK